MSAALRLLFRATLRRGWRGLLGIALLVGLAGGAVLTGAAAARRTDTAFDRMRVATNAWDVLVNPDDSDHTVIDADALAGLPEVAEVGRVDGVLLGPGHLDSITQLNDTPLTLATDGVAGYDFGRYQMLDGRMPDPSAVDEVLLTPTAADQLGVGVGDTVEEKLASFDALETIALSSTVEGAVAAYNSADVGRIVDVKVVGIGVPIDELVVDDDFVNGSVIVTPAFWEHYRHPTAGFFGLLVTLADGVTSDQLRRAVEGLAPDESIAFQTADAVAEQVDRAVGPEVNALRVFTIIAALVALVIVGQAVSRRLQLDAVIDPPLRALGLTRRQRAGMAVARMALAGAVGAVLAVVIAVIASPIGPIGIIRDAEPDPGIRVDPWVLVLGGLAVMVGTAAVSVWPAYRVARAQAVERTRPGLVSSRLVRWGVRPPAVMGARFALEPGPSAVPTGSTLVGAFTSVLLVAATITFAACLDHFVATPALYGTSWSDVVSVDSASETTPRTYAGVVDQYEADDRIAAYSMVTPGQVTLDGQSVPAFALGESPRPIHATVVEGRPPEADDEVVLGTSTLHDLGVDVGGEVGVTGVDGDEGMLTVVGRGVLPVIAAYPGSDKTTLGQGAVLSEAGLRQWSPRFSPEGLATRLRDGVAIDDVVGDLQVPEPLFTDVQHLGRPSDVASLKRVRSTPLLLSGLLAALIAVTVAHALGAAVRARRRELAVLRTFGFTRRQVVTTVATQATLIAAVALAVGIPAGIVVGRQAWRWVANSRDAVVALVTPVAALAVAALLVLAVANLVGLVPGLRAAQAHPADTLRAE